MMVIGKLDLLTRVARKWCTARGCLLHGGDLCICQSLTAACREVLEEAEKVVKEYEPDFTKGWPDDQRPYDEFAEKVIALARKNIAAALAALRGETP